MSILKKILMVGLIISCNVIRTESIRIKSATDFEAKKTMCMFAHELNTANKGSGPKVAKWLISMADNYSNEIDPLIASIIESEKNNDEKVTDLLQLMLEETEKKAQNEKKWAQDAAKQREKIAEQRAQYDAENKRAQIIGNIKKACALGSYVAFMAYIIHYGMSIDNLRTAQINTQLELLKQIVAAIPQTPVTQ